MGTIASSSFYDILSPFAIAFSCLLVRLERRKRKIKRTENPLLLLAGFGDNNGNNNSNLEMNKCAFGCASYIKYLWMLYSFNVSLPKKKTQASRKNFQTH